MASSALGRATSAADDACASKASHLLAAHTEREKRMRDTGAIVTELRRLDHRFESAAIAPAETDDAHHAREGATDAVLDTR